MTYLRHPPSCSVCGGVSVGLECSQECRVVAMVRRYRHDFEATEGKCQNCKGESTWEAWMLFDKHCSWKCNRVSASLSGMTGSLSHVLGDKDGTISDPNKYYGG